MQFCPFHKSIDGGNQQKKGEWIKILLSFSLNNIFISNTTWTYQYFFYKGKETFVCMGKGMKPLFKNMFVGKLGNIKFLSAAVTKLPVKTITTILTNMLHTTKLTYNKNKGI